MLVQQLTLNKSSLSLARWLVITPTTAKKTQCMKTIFFRSIAAAVPLIIIGMVSQAQSALPYVLASAGGTGTVAGGTTLNFTVGEPFVATAGTGATPRLTQGFQQPSTSATPLPIHLLDFSGTAMSGYNLLNWHTADEENNEYFDVERSQDGAVFYSIGRVYSSAVNGNSNTTIGYSFTDKTMPEGVNYYRLNQVDISGKSTRSFIISLRHTGTAQTFTLSPNPTTGNMFFTATGITDQSLVQVYNVGGKEIQLMKVTTTRTEIDLSRQAAGTYFIHYSDGQNSELIKVFKY